MSTIILMPSIVKVSLVPLPTCNDMYNAVFKVMATVLMVEPAIHSNKRIFSSPPLKNERTSFLPLAINCTTMWSQSMVHK